MKPPVDKSGGDRVAHQLVEPIWGWFDVTAPERRSQAATTGYRTIRRRSRRWAAGRSHDDDQVGADGPADARVTESSVAVPGDAE
jgi:hypothetical protein